jgi:hypothetical protein
MWRFRPVLSGERAHRSGPVKDLDLPLRRVPNNAAPPRGATTMSAEIPSQNPALLQDLNLQEGISC